MADSRMVGAWWSLDVAELRRELELTDDRRIEARAGSADHWQAIRDIQVLTMIMRSRLRRAVSVPTPIRRERRAAGGRPLRSSGSPCCIPGCSGGVGAERQADGPLADLCDVHVLELTSAPDR